MAGGPEGGRSGGGRVARRRCAACLEAWRASAFLAVAIVAHAASLTAETELTRQLPEAAGGRLAEPELYGLVSLQGALTLVFAIEYVFRARAYGCRFLFSPSGLFGLCLLALDVGAIVTRLEAMVFADQCASSAWCKSAMSVLLVVPWSFRALRLALLVPICPRLVQVRELEILCKGLPGALRTAVSGALILGGCAYAGGLLSVRWLRDSHACTPQGVCVRDAHGTLFRSFLTHMQVALTPRSALSAFGPLIADSAAWWRWVYVALFICITNFAILRLVTGAVCVGALQQCKKASQGRDKDQCSEA